MYLSTSCNQGRSPRTHWASGMQSSWLRNTLGKLSVTISSFLTNRFDPVSSTLLTPTLQFAGCEVHLRGLSSGEAFTKVLAMILWYYFTPIRPP